MKRLLGAVALALFFASPAIAQIGPGSSTPRVVSACGSNSQTAGGNGYLTIDPTGILCTDAGGGGTITVDGTAANNADNITSTASGNVPVASYGFVFDGTNWDRARAASAQVSGVISPNTGLPGVQIFGRFSDTESRAVPVAAFSNTDGNEENNQSMFVAANLQLFNGTSLDRGRDIIGAVTAGTGTQAAAIAPHSVAAGAITPVVTAAGANNLVIKNAAGNLYSVYASNLTVTAGFLMVFNATSAPADGAVTPMACKNIGALGAAEIDFRSIPSRYGTGITAVVSSGADCFTKVTGVITAFISGSAM